MVHKVKDVAITLEQARGLDALARHGTFAKAAAALGRGPTSVLYLIRTLEEAVGFAVVDRAGYRTTLTDHGERILEGCRGLLGAEAEFAATVDALRAGWEPSLTVIVDGLVPLAPVLQVVGQLARAHAATRLDVRTEFLSGVEDTFERADADVMITVVPPRATGLVVQPLPAIRASLVAHRRHPLATGRHTAKALAGHVLLTTRGSDPRLALPTANLPAGSTIHLSDFAAKRAAILDGLGFGWLPDAMVTRDLRRLRWTGASTHTFLPRLYHRPTLGRAGRALVAALVAVRAR
jgi:DNA-binding transcriptional LysR family regulator